MESTQQLAAYALTILDTSNLVGVAQSYAANLIKLRTALMNERRPAGTDDVADHPISRLWVLKLAELSGCTFDWDQWNDAYTQCRDLSMPPSELFTHAYEQGEDGKWYWVATVYGDHKDFYLQHGYRVSMTSRSHGESLWDNEVTPAIA